MTVSTTAVILEYDGNGSTTQFPITFQIGAQTELAVKLTLADGTEDAQVLTSDYTVAVAAAGTGTLTMLTAPPVGSVLRITRQTPKVQAKSLRNQGAYYPETVERMFDHITRRVQEVEATSLLDEFALLTEEGLLIGPGDGIFGESPDELRADIGSATATKGAALVGFDVDLEGFQPTTLAEHLQRSAQLNILSFIPAVEHAAIAARTSTYDCSGDVLNAINAAKLLGTTEIEFPPGTYPFASRIDVDSSGIYLVGGSNMYGDARATVFEWIGTAAAAANGLVYVSSPEGVSSYKQRNLGLRRILVNMKGVGDYGIVVRSINAGNFEDVTARGATVAQWLLTTGGTYAEAGDLQESNFIRCGFDAASEVGSEGADGFRFTGNNGNVSYNKFILCGGFHKNGDAWRIINGDNNTFEHPRTFHATGGTGYSVHIDGNGFFTNDYNRFLNHHFSAPVRLKGTESGFASAPIGLYFQSDSSNNSRNPEDGISTVDASVKVVTELYGTVRFGNVFGPIIIGEDVGAINNMGAYIGPLNPLCVWAGSGSWAMFGCGDSLYQAKPVVDAFQFYRADSPGNGKFAFDGEIQAAKGVGAFGATPPASKPQVTGSKASATAFVLEQVIGILAEAGFLTDNTTA